MTGQAIALDHVGIVGRDLDALVAAFERLGFRLTPLARHAGGRTGNRCIMLRDGYLELLAIMPGGSSATLDRFLARHAGVHILALGIPDVAATAERLRRAGIAAGEDRSERSTDETDPNAPRARFTLLTPPDLPEGRAHLIRHETPEALWQDRFLHHPNQATALREAILCTAQPAEAAARLSRLAGRPVTPDPAGGYALELARGTLRLVPPEAMAALCPGITFPTLPWIGGLTLATADGNASLQRRLGEQGVAYHTSGDTMVVEAGGVALRFRPDRT